MPGLTARSHAAGPPRGFSGASPGLLRDCLGQQRHEHPERDRRDGGAREIGGIEPRLLDQGSGDHERQRSAGALHGPDQAVGGVVPAGSSGDVGYDQRLHRAEQAGTDAVEALDRDQPVRVAPDEIEQGAHGQCGEADHEQGLAAPALGPAADDEPHRHHHPLRADDADGDDDGRPVRARLPDLLGDEGQQRRVGEMEKPYAGREDHERPAGQQGPPPGRGLLPLAAAAGPARVDGIARDGVECRGRDNGAGRDQEEHRAVREQPADEPDQHRDGDVPGPLQGGVAAEAAGDPVGWEQAERERRDSRAQHAPDGGQHAGGREHGPEVREERDEERGQRERDQGAEQDHALVAHRVDGGPDGRLHHDADDARHCADQPDRGIIPAAVHVEVDVEVGLDRPVHVDEQEVEEVQGPGDGWPSRSGRPLPLADVLLHAVRSPFSQPRAARHRTERSTQMPCSRSMSARPPSRASTVRRDLAGNAVTTAAMDGVPRRGRTQAVPVRRRSAPAAGSVGSSR
ncbi:hypothetical protein SAMN02799636_05079 [Methylobacterium sp. 275MFSha3.1]|nr:hypothetical protein SAMN02799636_05079 [Methylobacterium sp. 275MFSha3.1]